MNSHKTRATAAALSMPLLLGLAAAPALATETIPTTPDTTASSTVSAKGKEKRAARVKAPSRSRAPYKFGTTKYNQWYAKQYMQYKYGWGKKQRRSLVNLWNRESGWSQHAHNGSSGAHGIPQALPGSKMASHGKNWRSNPETQIKWGLSYIKGRYGTPNGAWNAFQNKGWY
ncbi:MAG: transglycosylase SLT domain-containing protein [Candidatus Nanopelagicales bacterium]|jgi:hypothetical protein|nr:MAG: hypothetical protein E6Q91_05355 [Actinomycetota bacterium]